MRPDYGLIAQLEYELGFTDEKPCRMPQTDAPGAVFYYDPRYGTPTYQDFKVSNTPPGTRQTQRTPGTPDPHDRKDRST